MHPSNNFRSQQRRHRHATLTALVIDVGLGGAVPQAQQLNDMLLETLRRMALSKLQEDEEMAPLHNEARAPIAMPMVGILNGSEKRQAASKFPSGLLSVDVLRLGRPLQTVAQETFEALADIARNVFVPKSLPQGYRRAVTAEKVPAVATIGDVDFKGLTFHRIERVIQVTHDEFDDIPAASRSGALPGATDACLDPDQPCTEPTRQPCPGGHDEDPFPSAK
jgi:hypothetical protein